MAFLTRQALARNTRKTYRSGTRLFRSFCSHRALIPLPADQSTLCLFAAYLSRWVGYQSTLTYLAAVAHWHRTMGFCNPAATCSNPRLQLILRGIRRVKARVPPRQVRHPITTSMLSCLCKSALHFTDGQDAVMFRAAMSLALFGCLRVSEFTFPERPGKRDSYPQLGDVSASSSSLVYHLRQSKTDQFCHGALIVLTPSAHGATCACTNMVAYLSQSRVARQSPSAPLFQLSDGRPLTRRRFVTFLKASLRHCGYNPKLFNSHSFRKGAASLAFQRGQSPDSIQRLGRWKSNAYRRYI